MKWQELPQGMGVSPCDAATTGILEPVSIARRTASAFMESFE